MRHRSAAPVELDALAVTADPGSADQIPREPAADRGLHHHVITEALERVAGRETPLLDEVLVRVEAVAAREAVHVATS